MKLSKLTSCRHCGNTSQMEIIGDANENHIYTDHEYGEMFDSGTTYSVLKCPACKKKNIVSYEWHDGMESIDEVNYANHGLKRLEKPNFHNRRQA